MNFMVIKGLVFSKKPDFDDNVKENLKVVLGKPGNGFRLIVTSIRNHSQKEVLGNYWTPAEAFGTTMEAKDYSKDIQTLLDEMVNAITAQ